MPRSGIRDPSPATEAVAWVRLGKGAKRIVQRILAFLKANDDLDWLLRS
jgi:hypothetical protein